MTKYQELQKRFPQWRFRLHSLTPGVYFFGQQGVHIHAYLLILCAFRFSPEGSYIVTVTHPDKGKAYQALERELVSYNR